MLRMHRTTFRKIVLPLLTLPLLMGAGSAFAANEQCDALEQKLQREQAIILEREKELSVKVDEEREKFEQDELDRLIIRHHASIEAFNLKLEAFKKTCGKRLSKTKKKPAASAKTVTSKKVAPAKVITPKTKVTSETLTPSTRAVNGTNPAEEVAASDELIKTLKGYFIQTGAFKNKAIAERFIRRLEKRGFTPTMIARPYVHAVWVGPYASHKEAKEAKEMLLTKYRVDGYIIRFK